MIKVFLAEDEFIVREGIKKNIDWASHGYEFVGEAADGELALPMIARLQPDIVITDIKMPFMDGLELSRLIKKSYPWIEIIILSGYAEFDYAKKAISIGVAHYMTKPVSGAELIEEIDRVAEKIREKKQERELLEQYMRDMEENSAEAKKKFFLHMVLGDWTVTELLEKADELSLDISAGCYNIMLFQAQSSHHSQGEYSGSMVELYEQIHKIADSLGALVFERHIEDLAVVLKADTPEQLADKQKELAEKLTTVLADYSHIMYCAAFGLPAGRLTELPVCHRQATIAYSKRFYMQKSGIFYYQEGEEPALGPMTEGGASEDFSLSQIDPNEVSRARISEFLHTGQPEEVELFVRDFFAGIGEGAAASNLFRQYLATEMYFAVSAFLESIGIDRSEAEAFDMAAGDIRDEEATKQYLTRSMKKAILLREQGVGNRYASVIEEAKRYIEENYADGDLSLNTLASHVNFSPNHLSMIFSEQTGKTFIKYLTDFRMHKARELLRSTAKRGADISYEVGYKDPHYFSFLFKKTQGMTPTQYRAGQGSSVTEE